MVKIEVDEAEFFDRLSILEVKEHFSYKTPEVKDKLANQFEQLYKIGSKQIAQMDEIYSSIEYKYLISANIEIFKGVDAAKQNTITAKQLDSLNYTRFLAKKRLQEKYFQKLTEIKIGYE